MTDKKAPPRRGPYLFAGAVAHWHGAGIGTSAAFQARDRRLGRFEQERASRFMRNSVKTLPYIWDLPAARSTPHQLV